MEQKYFRNSRVSPIWKSSANPTDFRGPRIGSEICFGSTWNFHPRRNNNRHRALTNPRARRKFYLATTRPPLKLSRTLMAPFPRDSIPGKDGGRDSQSAGSPFASVSTGGRGDRPTAALTSCVINPRFSEPATPDSGLRFTAVQFYTCPSFGPAKRLPTPLSPFPKMELARSVIIRVSVTDPVCSRIPRS